MDLLSTKEVSELLGVTSAMATNYCHSGALVGAFKIGRTWVIPQSAVENFERPKKGRPFKQETAVSAAEKN